MPFQLTTYLNYRFVFLLISLFVLNGCGGEENQKDPDRPVLINATSLSAGEVDVQWIITETDDSLAPDITYEIHISEVPSFTPSTDTLRNSVLAVSSAKTTGLKPATRYFVKVVASTPADKRSWSNELEFIANEVSAELSSVNTLRVLKQETMSNVEVNGSDITYMSTDNENVPEIGEIVSIPTSDSYLRRVESVSIDNSVVHIETVPASLVEAFDNLSFSSSFKLVKPPENQSISALNSIAMINGSVSRSWKSDGIELQETISSGAIALRASTASVSPTAVSNEGQQVANKKLIMRAPAYATVAPGDTSNNSRLELNVSAEIYDDDVSAYMITDMQLVKLDPPIGMPEPSNYQLVDDLPNNSDTRQLRKLYWVPTDAQVHDEGKPYKAIFYADAQLKDCVQSVTNWCNRHTAKIEVPIYVTWGDLPEKTNVGFSTDYNASINASADVEVDYSPNVNVDFAISNAALDSVNFSVNGPVEFNINTLIAASAGASAQGRKDNLLTRRFARVFMAGPVPVVMLGRFTLGAEINASVNSNISLTQDFDLVYDLSYGMNYSNVLGWNTFSNAEETYKYEIGGEATGTAEIEVRFLPDLELSFYDAATGKLIVEPYSFGEMDVEGHFNYSQASSSEATDDLAYRFTKMDVGGGIDLKLRADLTILDYRLGSWPSSNPDEYAEYVVVPKTVIYGLPSISLSQGDEKNVQFPDALQILADTQAVSELNNFVDESSRWEIVYPETGAYLLPVNEDSLKEAWFNPDGYEFEENNPPVVRFYGHSELGEYIQQYEEIALQPECPSEPDLIQGRYLARGVNCGIILDTVLNLEWQRCSEGMSWNNELKTCEGTPSRYEWYIAKDLTLPGGWRAPNAAELASLVYCSSGLGRYGNSGSTFSVDIGMRIGGVCAGNYLIPTIVHEAFPNTPYVTDDIGTPPHWTSEVKSSSGTYPRAYAVYFVEGWVLDETAGTHADFGHAWWVRLVRDAVISQ